MKTSSLLLVLAATPVLAGDPAPKVIDLGDGSSVKIEDGKVEVKASGSSSGNGSNSRGVSSTTTTDADGNTVTTIISEHNGVRETKVITTTPDGKVTVTDGDGKPAAPDKVGQPNGGSKNEKAPANDNRPAEAANSGGWLGVHTVPVPDATRAQVDIPEGEGIMIEFVAEDGPAAKAGLAENDILLRLNNAGIKDVASFRESLRKSRPGEKIRLDYLRKGKSGSVMVALAPRPKDAESGGDGNDAEDDPKANSSTSKRTVIVDADGNTRIIEGDGAEDPFEMLLKEPNVPAEMKKHIEEARKKMKELMPKDK